MYENLECDLDLKLLFMVTGAYYERGLCHIRRTYKIQQMYENLELNLDLKLLFMATGLYYEYGLIRTYFH